MGTDINLTEAEKNSFSMAVKKTNEWCIKNQWAVGVGEMALGAAFIAWGVHNGVIDMGSQLVATQMGGSKTEALIGAASGTSIGAVAGSVIGSIGVAGMGGAIGVPAAIVIGGAATVLGMAGYTVGDITSQFLHEAVNMSSLIANGSLLAIGTALVVHGAYKLIKDVASKVSMNTFINGVLHLRKLTAKIVATTKDGLQAFAKELGELPSGTLDTAGTIASSAVGIKIGASIGASVAASSVTILGSSTLGGLAVSAGLISAPIWPVILGIATGVGAGYTIYKAIKCLTFRKPINPLYDDRNKMPASRKTNKQEVETGRQANQQSFHQWRASRKTNKQEVEAGKQTNQQSFHQWRASRKTNKDSPSEVNLLIRYNRLKSMRYPRLLDD